jgi:hypothetical protein
MEMQCVEHGVKVKVDGNGRIATEATDLVNYGPGFLLGLH